MNDERARERGDDAEIPAGLGGIDDEIEEAPPPRESLGLVGQLVATLAIATIVGLLIVSALAVLSWLFT